MKQRVLKKLVGMAAFSQMVAALIGLFTTNAMAMAVPAAGSFAYDIYDIGVNQILLDPIVITKDNVDFLVKDGFYTKEQLGL